jgi:hypothetical protein
METATPQWHGSGHCRGVAFYFATGAPGGFVILSTGMCGDGCHFSYSTKEKKRGLWESVGPLSCYIHIGFLPEKSMDRRSAMESFLEFVLGARSAGTDVSSRSDHLAPGALLSVVPTDRAPALGRPGEPIAVTNPCGTHEAFKAATNTTKDMPQPHRAESSDRSTLVADHATRLHRMSTPKKFPVDISKVSSTTTSHGRFLVPTSREGGK